jgi:hypothetical protein
LPSNHLFTPHRLLIGFAVVFTIFVPRESLFPLVQRQF